MEFLHLRRSQTHFQYAHLIRLRRLLCGKARRSKLSSHRGVRLGSARCSAKRLSLFGQGLSFFLIRPACTTPAPWARPLLIQEGSFAGLPSSNEEGRRFSAGVVPVGKCRNSRERRSLSAEQAAKPQSAGHSSLCILAKAHPSSRPPPDDLIKIHEQGFVLPRPARPAADAGPAIILGALHQSRAHRVLMNIVYPLHKETLAEYR